MAFQHIYFNDQLPHGRQLRSMLNKAEQSDDEARDVLNTMVMMRDGDGSQAAHYAEVTAHYGFVSDVKSKEAHDELSSFWSKISGNNSVSDVRAARDQLFDKLRG